MQKITNIRITPNADTIKQIIDLADSFALPHRNLDEDPHCTIIYSSDFIDVKNIKLPLVELPIIGTNARFEIFETKDDGDVLVIEFDCEYAKKCFDYVKSQYGISTKYDEYRAHITLHKNLSSKYTKLPKIELNLLFDKLLIRNSD